MRIDYNITSMFFLICNTLLHNRRDIMEMDTQDQNEKKSHDTQKGYRRISIITSHKQK